MLKAPIVFSIAPFRLEIGRDECRMSRSLVMKVVRARGSWQRRPEVQQHFVMLAS